MKTNSFPPKEWLGKDPFLLAKTLVLNLRKDSRNKQKKLCPQQHTFEATIRHAILQAPGVPPTALEISKNLLTCPQTWLMAGLVRRQAQPKRSIWPQGTQLLLPSMVYPAFSSQVRHLFLSFFRYGLSYEAPGCVRIMVLMVLPLCLVVCMYCMYLCLCINSIHLYIYIYVELEIEIKIEIDIDIDTWVNSKSFLTMFHQPSNSSRCRKNKPLKQLHERGTQDSAVISQG